MLKAVVTSVVARAAQLKAAKAFSADAPVKLSLKGKQNMFSQEQVSDMAEAACTINRLPKDDLIRLLSFNPKADMTEHVKDFVKTFPEPFCAWGQPKTTEARGWYRKQNINDIKWV